MSNIKYSYDCDNQASTWVEHDCTEDVWHNSAQYTYVSCMMCDRILKFRFKSKWMRIKMFFWNGVS